MRRTESDTAAFLSGNAERMRWAPEPAERKLWIHLEPLGFEQQVEIVATTKNGGEYPRIMDFFHKRAMLCVECDGGYHARQRGRDRRRDTRLATSGIKTLRFTNRRCLNDTAAVVNEIRREIQAARL
jgi:very-short-patch-repair endonuclease